MAVIANAPLWVIIPLSSVLCLVAAVFPTIALRKRLAEDLSEEFNERFEEATGQMKRIRESFGALWDYANEKGLMEHAEHDKEMTKRLEELQATVYGRAPTLRLPSNSKPIRKPKGLFRNTRRLRKWRNR